MTTPYCVYYYVYYCVYSVPRMPSIDLTCRHRHGQIICGSTTVLRSTLPG